MATFEIHHGDNRDVLKTLADNSVDSVVTDPPYELGFMGKSWDASGIAYSVELWQEVLRVLKPGGHLLAFSGSRTYHRMVVAIEDAGFEIRDQIMWIYGSGFPKSLDIGKAIDKRGGVFADFTQFRDAVKAQMREKNIKTSELADALGNFMLSHYLTKGSQPAVPNYRDYKIIRDFVGLGDSFDHLFAEEAEREIIGTKMSGIANAEEGARHTIGASKAIEVDITAPATAEAKQWQGWGTALKPAHEPVVVARKPLIGTVAANVLTYGTGGLNIEASRVASDDGFQKAWDKPVSTNISSQSGNFDVGSGGKVIADLSGYKPSGRWPANVIHDGSDEVVELFPNSKSGVIKPYIENPQNPSSFNFEGRQKPAFDYGDSGSAARFFYCAKASKKDRNEGLDGFDLKLKPYGNRTEEQIPEEGDRPGSVNDKFTTQPQANHHPTVKPTDLMRYLCRLVTPPNGIVLDPFMGSGSTGKAAIYEGFNFVGIEMTDEYIPIAKARIEFAANEMADKLL